MPVLDDADRTPTRIAAYCHQDCETVLVGGLFRWSMSGASSGVYQPHLEALATGSTTPCLHILCDLTTKFRRLDLPKQSELVL
jgi:hypothetical protein